MFDPTQQKQIPTRRAGREAKRSSVLVKLAGLHQTAARDSQRLLQFVPEFLVSENQQRIIVFVWGKLQNKSWKKVLKVNEY